MVIACELTHSNITKVALLNKLSKEVCLFNIFSHLNVDEKLRVNNTITLLFSVRYD